MNRDNSLDLLAAQGIFFRRRHQSRRPPLAKIIPGSPAPTIGDMREHVLLFCLLGLVLTATIILVAAPGAVTWALALIE
jgi:xanthine/uracil/vitamin C permease (AzgA family)